MNQLILLGFALAFICVANAEGGCPTAKILDGLSGVSTCAFADNTRKQPFCYPIHNFFDSEPNPVHLECRAFHCVGDDWDKCSELSHRHRREACEIRDRSVCFDSDICANNTGFCARIYVLVYRAAGCSPNPVSVNVMLGPGVDTTIFSGNNFDKKCDTHASWEVQFHDFYYESPIIFGGNIAEVWPGRWDFQRLRVNPSEKLNIIYPNALWYDGEGSLDNLAPNFKPWADKAFALPRHPNVEKFVAAIKSGAALIVSAIPTHVRLSWWLTSQYNNLNRAQKLRVVTDIARGLQHLHNNGLTHGSLRPATVLATNLNQPSAEVVPVVVGYGFLLVDDGGDDRVRYQAPEVLQGNEATKESDVFSFGVLVWSVLNDGELPYPNIAYGSVYHKVVTEQKQQELLLAPKGTAQQLQKLLFDLLESNPSSRPNINHVVERLEAISY